MLAKTTAKTHDSWPAWVSFLRRFGLENLAAWLLESGGPLAVLGAQFIYLGGPFLRPVIEREQMEAIALLLEDRDEGHAFLAYLQEDAL